MAVNRSIRKIKEILKGDYKRHDSCSLTVVIKGININVGNILPLYITQKQPYVKICGKCNKYHTFLMVDPDAPSRENPTMRFWLHWMIVNNDETFFPFFPPGPPPGTGKHRYIMILFEQEDQIDIDKLKQMITERPNFDLYKFIKKYNLSFIDAVYFETKNPYVLVPYPPQNI